MTRYAEGTEVAPERSRQEIERTLSRYGASSFMYGWEGRRAVLGFRASSRYVRFELPLPDESAVRRTPAGRVRSGKALSTALEQEERRRWRALALAIKAKLEVVDSGISTFEEEFLAHIVLPNGSTVGSFTLPQVTKAYDEGSMPALLPGTGDE